MIIELDRTRLQEKYDVDSVKVFGIKDNLPESENAINVFVSIEKWIIVKCDKREDVNKQLNDYLEEYLQNNKVVK
jgi:hypothetical protein